MQRLQSDRSIAPLAAQFVPLKISSDGDDWNAWFRKHPSSDKIIKTPLLSVVRADGKLLDYHPGAPKGNDLKLYLQRNLTRAGRTLTLAQAETLEKLVEEATGLWTSGDRKAAIKKLSALRKLGPLGKLGSFAEPAVAADKLVAEWTNEFHQSLTEIRSKVASDPLPALIDFVELEDVYRNFEPAKAKLVEARRELRKKRELRELLRAADILTKAKLRIESGKSATSTTAALQKLIDDRPDTEVAKYAGELLAKAGRTAFRSWKDSSGKYEIVARFVRIDEDKVYLKRKRDGKTIAVPLEKLSESDRKLAERQAADE